MDRRGRLRIAEVGEHLSFLIGDLGGGSLELGANGELVAPAAAGARANGPAAAMLPPLFLEDLGRLLGGRRSVRLYIADAAAR